MQETKPVIWKPLPGAQQKFLTCPHYEVLLEGNRGGGKTDALLMDFAQFVGRGFGSEWRGVIFRQTYPQLGDVINKSLKWFSQIFPNAKYNQTRHQWEFATGETLLFRFGESDLDYWNYHGHAYPFLGFEELTNWKDPAFYEAMQSTCRSTDPRVPRMVRATTNPFGKGHSWVKERFQIGAFPPCVAFGKGRKKRVYIHSSLQENTILTTADPEYVETLKNLKEPARRAAWLEGSWDIAVGTFLEKVWDPATCVVDPFPIPANWRVWKGMDWGYSKPYAVLWLAMNEEGVIFVWRELYGIDADQPNVGSKEDAVKVASKIKQIEKHDSRYGYEYRANLADPAIFSNIGTSRSIGQIFRDAGVRWLPAWNGRGSRVNGAQEIVRLLAEGRLKFFKSCTNCIRTIPQLPPSDYDPEDVDTDAEDHCFTPDTLVFTNKGYRRIDSLGDARVLNQYGRWVTPQNWRVIKHAEIVRVLFEDGASVICTPDHKFLTSIGWVEAKDLEGKGVKAWKLKSSATTASRLSTKKPWLLQQNTQKPGTPLKKDGNGTKSIIREQKKTCTKSTNASAQSAVRSLNLLGEKGNIAATAVKQQLFGDVILVTSVENVGTADVGCISVPDGESFCLFNGAIAHNCWDALRYSVMRKRRAPNKDDHEAFRPDSEAEIGDGFISFDVDP